MPTFWEYHLHPNVIPNSWADDLKNIGQSQMLLYTTNILLVVNTCICTKFE